jgi:glycosyltransferase involved in cell wall biosynthesis
MARLLPEGERAIISHVHELEIGLSHWVQPRDRHVLLEQADRIFSVADAVTRNLVTNHGVSPDLISRHPGMVDLREIEDPPVEEARRDARRARGLPAEGLIVGTSGTVYWRKAFDLFLQLAARLTADTRPEPVSFVWLGGEPGAIGHATRLAEILGVADLVHFVETQPDPIEWFSLMDVFVLPSREDPFPLVCLEALSVGVPVVAFDTGGMPELLDQGCGLVSPYPDLHDLARKVDSLLSDPELRRTLGDRGRELIRSGYDVSVLAPRLWADISPWLP